jgi:hypothetical protein
MGSFGSECEQFSIDSPLRFGSAAWVVIGKIVARDVVQRVAQIIIESEVKPRLKPKFVKAKLVRTIAFTQPQKRTIE